MKLVEVKSLYDKKATIEVIVQMPPPLAQEIPASASNSPYLELAIQVIKDDAHNIIGIWGMGGVGKTHLLKQIPKALLKDHAFEVMVFITCSRECSEEKVQNEIINKLDLQKNDSMEQKQSIIHNFLSQRSFVLLLDDLWNRVDLETIGIPNLMSKRKVVLTTRSTEVCGQMEVQKTIKVKVLSEDDAWSLFKEKVTEETINSDPLIQQRAVEVMKELGRLPLALITVGRAMYDKVDLSEWEQAIMLLKQARIYDLESSCSNNSIFHTLRFGYDSLKNETLKQCFLHCSLWPDDCLINKSRLVELWMGLGLINESEINLAYNTGYSHIRRLQAACLLEETDDDDMIKMHDVIRDMALWISSNQGVQKYKWIVLSGPYKQHQVIQVPHDTEKLSLISNWSIGSPTEVSFSIPASSTKLSTLLLSGCFHLRTLRLELFSDLTVLDLSGNYELEGFPIEICKLVNLEFLNLSKISGALPNEFETLINLKYLIMRSNCTIPVGLLSKLKALRVLNTSGDNVPMRCYLGDFSSLKDELQCLPEFQALGISIHNMHDFQKLSQSSSVPVRWLSVIDVNEKGFLSFTNCFLGNSQLQIKLSYLIISGRKIEWVKFEKTGDDQSNYYLRRLEKMSFYSASNMEGVVWKGLDPKDVFPRLQILCFACCDKLKSISWIVHLPCIRELSVNACQSIKRLISINELNNGGLMVSQPSFSFLKKITLQANFELESISDPMITLPALEFFFVHGCNELKKLPFKTSNPPKKLQLVGTEEWWNNIEMEDNSHRSLLRPFFEKRDIVNQYVNFTAFKFMYTLRATIENC
jgi:NB-ARC domain